MTYIYAFLVSAKRRMPFIYAKVLNGILLDFGETPKQGFSTGEKGYPTKGEKGEKNTVHKWLIY